MKGFFSFVVALIIFLEIFSPLSVLAFTPITHSVLSKFLVYCSGPHAPICTAVSVAIEVFLTLFKSKIACSFGAETGIGGIIKGGLSKNIALEEALKINDFIERINKSDNFGGQIIKVMECKCGGDTGIAKDLLGKKNVFLIGDPRPAVVGLTPGSKVYNYKSLKEGAEVLGKKTNQKVCTNPIAYAIKQVGTSR